MYLGRTIIFEKEVLSILFITVALITIACTGPLPIFEVPTLDKKSQV